MGLLESDPRDVTRAVQADPVLRRTLDAVWPAVSPKALVRDLLSNAEQLVSCAEGILEPAEQDAIRRARNAPWTVGDLALVDEARDLLEGHTSTYGHVIVDEAQDLSPMQLRMIGRRAPSASVTVLGDLAQATAAWVAHLVGGRCRASRSGRRQGRGGVAKPRPHTRLPCAGPRARFCGAIAPRGRADGAGDGVGSSRPASAAGAPGRGRRTLLDRGDRGGSARGRGIPRGLHRRGRARSDRGTCFAAEGVEFGTPERDGILKAITLLPAPTAKGLEFDAVVVVEPAIITGGTARGLRLLYVALTRPIQRLTVVHALPLPVALRR